MAISLLAIGSAESTKITRKIAVNELRMAEARQIALAGLEYGTIVAISAFNGPFRSGHIRNPNDMIATVPQMWRFAKTNVQVSVESEDGKIDVNRADLGLIFAALQQLGVEKAGNAVEQINARRTRVARTGRRDTQRAPKAFETLEAFASLPQMNGQSLDQLSRVFTTRSGKAQPVFALATSEVQSILPTQDEGAGWEKTNDGRALGRWFTLRSLVQQAPEPSYPAWRVIELRSSTDGSYRIRAERLGWF